MNTKKISMVALAICINLIGAQIALLFRLPIYLDCIGTVLIAALYGPVYGMIPNVLSGTIFFMMGDAFSLYYAPAGILLGLLTGWIWKYKKDNFVSLLITTLIVVLPTSFCSACITAYLFGGITSSGSSILVQLLKTPLGLTMACFVVQVLTDFIDKFVAMALVTIVDKRIPDKYKK